MKTRSKIWLTAALAATLIVSGCGSNDDGGNGAGSASSVPDSASASPAAFIAYLMTLSPNDESSEPLTLSDSAAVPNDEASEPQPLV